MAETITLGKVSVSPKGAYSSTASYTFLDAVSHNGGAFLCLQNSTGVEPGVSSGWQSYWMETSKGIKQISVSSAQEGQATITVTLSDGTVSTVTFDTGVVVAQTGEGPPTTSTVAAYIGQLYVDTTATENPAYICVGITTADNVTTYVWQPIGGSIEDGSITIEKLAPAAISELGQSYNYADNSDFTQWVAQAGIGGNHGNQAYGGDRWILDSGTITGTARADGNGYENITLNGVIRQIVANPPATGTVGVDMISGTAAASYADGEITITSAGGVIKDVWLYKEIYEAGAAPKYQPKGYAAELSECMWDFIQLVLAEGMFSGKTYSSTGDKADIVIPLPSPMRVNPTLISDLTICTLVTGVVAASGSLTNVYALTGNIAQVTFEAPTSATANSAAICRMIGVLQFVADRA